MAISVEGYFGGEYMDLPAKVFTDTREAEKFLLLLNQLEVSYLVHLDMPRKRLNLPMQTIVMLVGTEEGVRH